MRCGQEGSDLGHAQGQVGLEKRRREVHHRTILESLIIFLDAGSKKCEELFSKAKTKKDRGGCTSVFFDWVGGNWKNQYRANDIKQLASRR